MKFAKLGTSLKIAFLAVIGGGVDAYWTQSATTTGLSFAYAECRITHVVDADTLDLKCGGTRDRAHPCYGL